MYRTFFKRLLDIILSGCAIVILSPLLLVIAIAIKIDDPGPVLFRQKRVGLYFFNLRISAASFLTATNKEPPPVWGKSLKDNF